MVYEQDILTFGEKSYPIEALPLEGMNENIHEMLPSLPGSLKRHKMHEKSYWGRGYMMWWELSGEELLLSKITRYVPGIKAIDQEVEPLIHANWFDGEVTICNIDDVIVVKKTDDNGNNPYKLFPDCSHYNIFELSHLHFENGLITGKTRTIIKPDKKNHQLMEEKATILEQRLKYIFNDKIKEIDRIKEYKERLKEHKKFLKWKVWRDF